MKLFENNVGRPSKETIRKRKKFKLAIFIFTAFLCSVIVALGVNLASEIISNQKFASASSSVIPVYLNGVTPAKAIQIDLNSNSKNGYTSGQGMTRVKVKGKWYILTGVILNSRFSTEKRNSSTTYMYIIEENSGAIKATIKDYCFGHINTITNDGSHIYIYGRNHLYKLTTQYVADAVANKFRNTQSYIVSAPKVKKSLASLTYDKNSGYLYGSNKNNLYRINPDTLPGVYDCNNKATSKLEECDVNPVKVLNHSHIAPHFIEKKMEDTEGEEKNADNESKTKLGFAMTNSGAVIWRNYLLLGRFYSKGIGSSSVNKNTIDIYKLTFDSNKRITASTYLATYVFNSGDLLKSEIQDLEIVNNDTLLIHYNGGTVNKLYYLDLKKLNFTKVKVLINGKGVEKNSLRATLYNSKGEIIDYYKPNSNSNLIIRNLSKGNYTLKIDSTNNDTKAVQDKVIRFTINPYLPYQYLKIKA